MNKLLAALFLVAITFNTNAADYRLKRGIVSFEGNKGVFDTASGNIQVIGTMNLNGQRITQEVNVCIRGNCNPVKSTSTIIEVAQGNSKVTARDDIFGLVDIYIISLAPNIITMSVIPNTSTEINEWEPVNAFTGTAQDLPETDINQSGDGQIGSIIGNILKDKY